MSSQVFQLFVAQCTWLVEIIKMIKDRNALLYWQTDFAPTYSSTAARWLMLLKTQKDSHSKCNQTLSPTRGRKSCDRQSLLLYFFYRCINVYGRRIFTTHITHNMQISVDSIGQADELV